MRLTDAERKAIREGLPHMACPKPGELGACGCPDVYEAVETIVAARVRAAKVEALREAAEIITLRTNHVGCESCRINAEGEAGSWLLARADRIEEDR